MWIFIGEPEARVGRRLCPGSPAHAAHGAAGALQTVWYAGYRYCAGVPQSGAVWMHGPAGKEPDQSPALEVGGPPTPSVTTQRAQPPPREVLPVGRLESHSYDLTPLIALCTRR